MKVKVVVEVEVTPIEDDLDLTVAEVAAETRKEVETFFKIQSTQRCIVNNYSFGEFIVNGIEISS